MKVCFRWIPVLLFPLATLGVATAASSTDPTTVLVLVNDSYPAETGTGGLGASVFVGMHYAQARGIPSANVLHLNIPLSTLHYATNEFITYADYLTYIQNPLKSFLASSGLKDKINYIVPTYGVPVMLDSLTPDPESRISVDSVLAGMYSNTPSILLTNPYYTSDASSSPTHIGNWKNPQAWKLYLVVRLDGPTAVIAAALVDKAITAEANMKKTDGFGYYDYQHRYDYPDPNYHQAYLIDQTVLNAYNLGVAAGLPSVLNDQSITKVMFSPASTYTYSAGQIAIFAEGVSTLTSRFNFTPVQSGRFRTTFNVLSNTGGAGLSWFRLYSADRKSYWELAYSFPGFLLNIPVTLSKVVNGAVTGSCSVPVSITPVATDLSFTFSSNGGEVFKGAASLCKFSDSSSSQINVSQGELVFEDLSINVTGISVQDGNSAYVWNDSFGSDTTSNYSWITFPRQAPNAAWLWGWYSPIADAYTFVNGAVGSQYNSYTANSIRGGGVPNVDGNWCVYLLRQGITATWGATNEPSGIDANGDNLLGHFWRGYTFGESSYLANPALNWTMVFIGDPLYAPPIFKVAPTPPVVNISAPMDGAVVNGYVTLSGTAQSPSGVSSVSIKVDGTLLQIASGTTQWQYLLDTTQLTNGSHLITVVVQDDNTNQTAASINITVNNALPAVTSPGTATGTVGSAFSYLITASNSPNRFGATGLPAGLTINTTTGLISGTPQSAGLFTVTVSATNASGTGTKALILTISGNAPVITSAVTATGTVGSAFSFQIAATNNPTVFGALPLPAGLGVNVNTGVISGVPLSAGTTAVNLSAANGTGTGNAVLTLTINPLVTPPTNSAVFVKADTTTQGTWKGVYGSAGGLINSEGTNPPSFAAVNIAGSNTYIWTNSTTDVRALQRYGGNRIASVWYSPTAFTVDVNITDGQSHQIALYLLDWDGNGGGRQQRVDVLDAATQAVLSSQTLGNFGQGQYLVWTASGHITFQLTNLNPYSNAVLNGIFFDSPPVITSPTAANVAAGSSFNYAITASNGPTSYNAAPLPAGLSINTVTGVISGTPSASGTTAITLSAANGFGTGTAILTLTVTGGVPPPGNSAVFVKSDSTTQGNWKGVYGADGELINSDSAAPPSYATVNIAGFNTYVWANSTSDVRAPLKAASSDRIASVWYSQSAFTVDVNITDGKSHQIAFYSVDWDGNGGGRQQRVDVLDASSQAVLSSQSLNNFGQGQYLVWTVSGHVTFKLTSTNPLSNSVLNGIFFGGTAAGGSAPVITSATTASVAAGSSFNYAITASNGPTSYYASPLPAGLSINTASGVISGTPSASGTTAIALSAANGFGTGTAVLTLTVTGGAPPPGNSAVFVKVDSTTQGNWKGVYGADGELINSDSTAPPSYAAVNIAGFNTYVWANSTSDVRAPLKAASSDRIASVWYSQSAFTVDVNITDGKSHQIALYSVDWDGNGGGRQQRVDVLDASTQAVLSSQSLANFGQGQYLIWTVSGHVTFKLISTNPFSNSVLNGIFFGGTVAGGSAPVISSPTAAIVAAGSSFNYTIAASNGPTGYNATPLPAGLSINTATGVISGTPSASGTTPITLSAANGFGTGTAVLTLTVTAVAPPGNSAVFVKVDSTTQGNWKGIYGANGELINSDSANPPSYASVSIAGFNTYIWTNSTSDVRAPQKAASSDRIASVWYSQSAFTVDVNITDGKSHQIALYSVDWDGNGGGRQQRVDVLDASSQAVLSSQSLANFGQGQYLVWTVSGHVTFKLTSTNPLSNSVLNGIFF